MQGDHKLKFRDLAAQMVDIYNKMDLYLEYLDQDKRKGIKRHYLLNKMLETLALVLISQVYQ